MVDNEEEKHRRALEVQVNSIGCCSQGHGGTGVGWIAQQVGSGVDLELVKRACMGDITARLAIHRMTLGIRVKSTPGIDIESIRANLAWRLFSSPHRLAGYTGRSTLRSYLASSVRHEVSSARRTVRNREHLLRDAFRPDGSGATPGDRRTTVAEHPAELVRAAIHESLYDGCFHRNGPGAPIGLAGAIGRGMIDAIEDLIAIHSQLLVLGHLGSMSERARRHGPVIDAYAAAGLPVRGGQVSRQIVEVGTETTIDFIDSVCDAVGRSSLRGRKSVLSRLRAARDCGRSLLRGAHAA